MFWIPIALIGICLILLVIICALLWSTVRKYEQESQDLKEEVARLKRANDSLKDSVFVWKLRERGR
ncbi:MAG: hypothetical protein HQL24_05505 [Candidatus Omnitrophica bacterium]|nr:hypothetical protein [Candidatus Omnitrophota bacterium]